MDTYSSTPLAENLIPENLAQKLEFRGNAKEYFRIWIVNLCLTLITFGIYSAWAKVRTRRYFYGNLYLDGANFGYHGNPIKILYGRLAVIALFLCYFGSARISPLLSLLFLVIFAVLFPWIIVRGLIFNLGNTSYRNVRFGFNKDYKGSYDTYFRGIFVSLCSLGLGFPYVVYLHKRFRIGGSKYGNVGFTYEGNSTPFFAAYYGSAGIYFLIAMVVSIFFFSFGQTQNGFDPGSMFGSSHSALYGAIVGIAIGLTFATAYRSCRVFNEVANATKLGDISFMASLDIFEVFWLYLTNFLACIFTLGMAYPWVVVRLLNYRIQHMNVFVPPGGLEKFSRDSVPTVGAAADAVVDFLDIDLGF